MVDIVKGNILMAKEEIICHQVNCLGVMGGGLALQIRNKYPEVYKEYSEYCDQLQDERDLMLGSVLYVPTRDGKTIANLFGQLNIGRGIQTDYSALRRCLYDVREQGKSVAIPFRLGCGLAGGDWPTVLSMIIEVFKDYPNTVKIYEL